MDTIQPLRKLALKLEASGTAIPLSSTKLYRGGFGFVGLSVYVPVTPNRTAGSKQLCTVHRTTIDAFGSRKQFLEDKYNLCYVDTVTLDTGQYLLFERPLPKPFTDTEGELELVINYCELGTNAQGEEVVVSRLASNVYRTTVEEGGAGEGETVTDLKGLEAAQINANTMRVQALENVTVSKVLVDFTLDRETGIGTKTYSDGSTGEFKLTSGGTGETLVSTDWLKVIEFSAESFIGGELAFAPEQTGFEDNRYVASLERKDKQTYKAGQATAASEKAGYSSVPDSYFKGSDGSLLLYGITEPFDGRLILLGGSAFSGEFVTGAEYEDEKKTLVLKYITGAKLEVPLSGLVPETLPSPYGITIRRNGAAITRYDGSSEADVNITVPVRVGELNNDLNYQTGAQVSAAVAAIVSSAPETLDTLKELAAALNNDANFAATVSAQLAQKSRASYNGSKVDLTLTLTGDRLEITTN